jgi:hypothetical protein
MGKSKRKESIGGRKGNRQAMKRRKRKAIDREEQETGNRWRTARERQVTGK